MASIINQFDILINKLCDGDLDAYQYKYDIKKDYINIYNNMNNNEILFHNCILFYDTENMYDDMIQYNDILLNANKFLFRYMANNGILNINEKVNTEIKYLNINDDQYIYDIDKENLFCKNNKIENNFIDEHFLKFKNLFDVKNYYIDNLKDNANSTKKIYNVFNKYLEINKSIYNKIIFISNDPILYILINNIDDINNII